MTVGHMTDAEGSGAMKYCAKYNYPCPNEYSPDEEFCQTCVAPGRRRAEQRGPLPEEEAALNLLDRAAERREPRFEYKGAGIFVPVPAAQHEPTPQPGRETVLPHVLADLTARALEGRKKYGTLLETHNGRDALMDAYQEALDLVMYLKQVLMEREDPA